MDFAFNDEQERRRRDVRRVLAAEFPLAALREFDQVTPARQEALSGARWRALSTLGIPSFLVPPSAGGLGLRDVDLVGVFEEIGWSALPEPLLETAGLAAPMLAALLPAPAAVTALRGLLSGSAPVAVGGIDVGVAGPTSPTTVSADGTLRTPRVAGARGAATLLLACRDADSGWQLHAVPVAVCTVSPMATLDRARDLSTVHWPLSADTLVAYGVAAQASVELMADRGAAGSAALLVGLADRMITMAAAHVADAHRNGQAIPNAHAVRQMLVDARIRLELARPVTYRAAWSLATAQAGLSHDASMAKAVASDAAELAARAALPVHGAVGDTDGCDLPFFMQRTWALAHTWGDAPTHRQLVLDAARRHRQRPMSSRP